MTEQRTTPEIRAAARERARLRDEKGFEYTAVEAGTLTALCDDADALAGALAERDRYRQALRAIQGWDCLNPPQSDLCADFPWLRRLVDDALAPPSGAGQEGAPDAPRMPQDAPHGANSPKARSAKIAGATGDSGAKTGGIEG